MAFRIIGEASGALAEVETNPLAARGVLYPQDFNVCGSFSERVVYNAGFLNTTNQPLAAFQWTSPTRLALVKSIIMGYSTVDTSAGVVAIRGILARAFTTQHSTQATAAVTSGDQQKRRSRMAAGPNNHSLVVLTDNSGVMAGAVYVLDANPFCSFITSRTGVAGKFSIAATDLYRAEVGDYPLLLRRFEGLEIQIASAGTGVAQVSITFNWDEVENY